MEKDGFSINDIASLTYPCESGLLLHKIHKSLVQIVDLHMKRTIKMLQKNIGEYLFDLRVGKDF